LSRIESAGLDELRTSDKLPSPSGIALEILKLTRDENTSSEQLGKVLVRDPALAGQVLKYANSAQIRTGKEVKTVAEAVTRLGTTTVRQLALGFSLLASARSGPCESFDYTGFWTGSLASAVGAQVLSQHLPGVVADEAFTCGLLGQIGRLCLASVHPEDYALILTQWDHGPDERLVQLERNAFSIDHNEISAALFEEWGLPENFQEAVLHQEDPVGVQNLPDPRQTLPRLLCLSNQLATICIAPEERRDELVHELLLRGKTLGLGEETVAASCEAALAEWQRMGQVLDLIIKCVPPIQKLVARARASLGAITGEAQVPGGVVAERLRILVVDDSAVDRRVLEKMLKNQGHEVTAVESAEAALDIALQTNPQVIVTDWLMPGMTGLELCAALRRAEETARTYLIMMTAKEDGERLIEPFEAGADDYLVKPLNQSILLARLSAAQRLIGLQERVERDREEIRRVVAQLGIANRKLERAAMYDDLTGLPNRRYAMDHLEREWDRSERSGKPVVCMLADIDRFKQVNDTYGHDAGDVVLRETAAAMKNCLRTTDVVCRFGGEEFLAICPEAELETASLLGDRLRAAVEKNEIDLPEFRGHVTVSVGVAGKTADIGSIAELLKLSDEALYAAKHAGRNKVCVVDCGAPKA
jgi:diguanylate cyclase (GGDEF)-like protein